MLSSKPRPVNSAWPQLKTIKQEPVKIINVTGAKASTSFFAKIRNESESECDLDNDVPTPTPKQTFGDVIAMALEKAAPISESHIEGI